MQARTSNVAHTQLTQHTNMQKDIYTCTHKTDRETHTRTHTRTHTHTQHPLINLNEAAIQVLINWQLLHEVSVKYALETVYIIRC